MQPEAAHSLLVLLCCVLCATDTQGWRRNRAYQLNNTWASEQGRKKSDIYSETPDILHKFGYPAETHVVTTDDGYILTLHRIPHGRNSTVARIRTPVLVMHGILSASDLWLLTGPDKALGFILADAGYDVWLGNARGNYYSRKHVTLKPGDPRFWDFSWHEMGNNDLPAVIDYMLATTQTPQIFYIGYSMGCTMFYVLMSTQPQYNDKVKHMVGLAPVALNGRLRNSFGEFYVPYLSYIVEGFYRSNQYELLPRVKSNILLAESACQEPLIGRALCQALYFTVFGVNPKQLNKTLLPIIWSHLLAGTSVQTLNHYVQNGKLGRFQLYDKTRKRRKMPLYNLTQVTAPVSLHYALNDALLNPNAVMKLARQLPNIVKIVRLPEARATHGDFTIAIDSKTLVYNEVLGIMQKYN